jgi:hypothetical protein
MVSVDSRIDVPCEATRSTFYVGPNLSAMAECELGESGMTAIDNVERLSTRYTGLDTVEGSMSREAYWKRLVTSQVCLFVILILGLPSLLHAQKEKGSWSDLNRLKAGQGIEVIESNMKRHAGAFVTVTDEVLSLQENGSDVSLKREDVVRVSTSSGPRRGEHAVIGLVVGGLIGAGIGAASGSSHGFLGGSSRGIGALVGIAIGAPSGALVGAVIPAHTTIYRAAPAASHPASP